jgi:hypothetical protein
MKTLEIADQSGIQIKFFLGCLELFLPPQNDMKRRVRNLRKSRPAKMHNNIKIQGRCEVEAE